MIIISHRGNTTGPGSCIENHPASIDTAIELGFDVEIDLWVTDELELFLGHDYPEFQIQLSWLTSRQHTIWVHCKNMGALEFLTNYKNSLRFFFHQTDDYVLTSQGDIWVYPGKLPPKNSIIVLPELSQDWNENLKLDENLYGICTDFPVAVSRAQKN